MGLANEGLVEGRNYSLNQCALTTLQYRHDHHLAETACLVELIYKTRGLENFIWQNCSKIVFAYSKQNFNVSFFRTMQNVSKIYLETTGRENSMYHS